MEEIKPNPKYWFNECMKARKENTQLKAKEQGLREYLKDQVNNKPSEYLNGYELRILEQIKLAYQDILSKIDDTQ